MSAVEVLDTRSAVAVTVDGLTVVSPLVNLWVLLGPLVTVMMPWLELSEEVLTAVVVASCVRAGLVVEEYFIAERVTIDGLSSACNKSLSFTKVGPAPTHLLGRRTCVCQCTAGHSTFLHAQIWQRHSPDLPSSWAETSSSSGTTSHCRQTTSNGLWRGLSTQFVRWKSFALPRSFLLTVCWQDETISSCSDPEHPAKIFCQPRKRKHRCHCCLQMHTTKSDHCHTYTQRDFKASISIIAQFFQK